MIPPVKIVFQFLIQFVYALPLFLSRRGLCLVFSNYLTVRFQFIRKLAQTIPLLVSNFYVFFREANKGISTSDTEINIRKGSRICRIFFGSYEPQPKSEFADFYTTLHDVNAENVVENDVSFDLVI